MSLRTGMIAVLTGIVVFLGVTGRLPGVKGNTSRDMGPVLAAPRPPDAGATPVLVELFTSEGCSSCPPADALLMRLGRTQPVRGADVIVLEEHVNYWDDLGWKDPFSSEAATKRQGDYGRAFGGREIYTPQMVVDGHVEFIGSSEGEALSSIRSASKTSKPAIHLTWSGEGALDIHVDPLTNASRGDSSQVHVAVTESDLHSSVKRGENGGRELDHDGVVRQLTTAGKIERGSAGFSSSITLHAAPGWNQESLRAVVFVQEDLSRRVLTASSISFPIT